MKQERVTLSIDELKRVWEQFRMWLSDMWSRLLGDERIQIDPRLREVFGQILSGDPGFGYRYGPENSTNRLGNNQETHYQFAGQKGAVNLKRHNAWTRRAQIMKLSGRKSAGYVNKADATRNFMHMKSLQKTR
jgi:hypothetical protein